jgi:hypothetical protein
LLAYVFWPTAVPPAAVDWGLYPARCSRGSTRGQCLSVPARGGGALFGLWLDRELRELQCGRAWHWGNWLWSGLIVFSTLATKQHVLLDVLAGSALAAAAAALSPGLRRSRSGGGRGGITV